MLRSSSTIVTVALCAKERAKSATVTHVYSRGRIGHAGAKNQVEIAGARKVSCVIILHQ